MWRFGRYSERNKQKSPFSTTPLSFEAPSPAKPREYPHKPYFTKKQRSLSYIFAAKIMGLCSFKSLWLCSESQVCIVTNRLIAVQGQLTPFDGHPKSLILAPIESTYVASYWWSKATLVLSCTILEIRWLIGRKIAKIANSYSRQSH